MSDTRRDQLIDYIEKEFIGPDPIDWPGMTQNNGEEILTTDPPRTRYIAGILYPRETTDTDVDTREGESEPVTGPEGEDPGAEPAKKSRATPEFLENAEELINRSNAYRQSAISITVAIKSEDNIRVKVSAGTYTTLTAIDPKTERKVTTYFLCILHRHGVPKDIPHDHGYIRRVKIHESFQSGRIPGFDPLQDCCFSHHDTRPL